jgi:TPP-dependent pyruvate/acetoin dehydrogenase alpha subunit
VTAVFEVTDAAVKRARRGEGPTLIEAKTYRYDEHNVGLLVPGNPYRPREEVEEYRTQRDPIALFRSALLQSAVAEGDLTRIEKEVVSAVTDAIRFGQESPLPTADTLYDYMYSNPQNTPNH